MSVCVCACVCVYTHVCVCVCVCVCVARARARSHARASYRLMEHHSRRVSGQIKDRSGGGRRRRRRRRRQKTCSCLILLSSSALCRSSSARCRAKASSSRLFLSRLLLSFSSCSLCLASAARSLLSSSSLASSAARFLLSSSSLVSSAAFCAFALEISMLTFARCVARNPFSSRTCPQDCKQDKATPPMEEDQRGGGRGTRRFSGPASCVRGVLSHRKCMISQDTRHRSVCCSPVSIVGQGQKNNVPGPTQRTSSTWSRQSVALCRRQPSFPRKWRAARRTLHIQQRRCITEEGTGL